MKVEKTSHNKIKIVLSENELEKRNLSIKDLTEGKSKAQDFFLGILEESNMADDFLIDSSQLLVEVSVSQGNILSIVITKADCIPDIDLFDKDNIRTFYTVSSNLYEFESLKEIYDFSKKALHEDLYVGENSLYYLCNKYYLLFSNATIKKAAFIKTFSIITEYAIKYYSKKLAILDEYGNIIIKDKALQYFQKI